MADDFEKSLKGIRKDQLAARENLSEEEKDDLVQKIGGPLTADSIRKAQLSLPKDRIPFLFSSLDTQLIVDIMANDMRAAIARARAAKKAAGAAAKDKRKT